MVGIHNLHPEGMAYSPGDDESRVVLLFESPGINEVVMGAPLSGTTGMRYCQIVRSLKKRGDKIGGFDWFEFCKNNATIINAVPCFSNETHEKKVERAIERNNLNSIVRLISHRHEILLCFGRCACSVVDKMDHKHRPQTILKCWHISSINGHCSDLKEHGKMNPLWKYQLEVIVQYIVECAGKKGVFGWKSIADAAPKDRPCHWVHKNREIEVPEWIKGAE